MARKVRKASPDRQVRLLENLLIAQLAMARVPQAQIRQIVGCEMSRVSAIAKHIPAGGAGRGRGRRGRNGQKHQQESAG